MTMPAVHTENDFGAHVISTGFGAATCSRRIAVSLRTQGILAKAVGSAPDPGITTTACKQRDTTSQKQRMGNASKRAPRAGIISRTDARVEKGYSTGVDPQMLYCTPLFGASFAMVARMRTIALKVLRRVGHRPCPFTTIIWKLGPSKDPGIATAVRSNFGPRYTLRPSAMPRT